MCFLKRQLAQLLLYQLNWPQILELGYYPAVWLNTPFATFATAASLESVRKYTPNEHGYWEVETATTRLIESNESR